MLRLILLRLLESYFRHRWLYLSPILFMSLAMVGYLTLVPAPYVAEGTLYVQKETLLSTLTSVRTNVFGRYVTPAEETVGELYQLMNSDGFMRAIIQQTDLEPLMNEGPRVVDETLEQVRDSIWFRSLGNNLVEVNTEAELPQVAAQLATSTIETYTRWKTNISRDEGVAAQQFFQGLVDTYRTDLNAERNRLTDYLVGHPEPVRGERPPVEAAQIAQLEAAVALAEERLRNAEDKEEETQLALAQTESNIRQSYIVVDAPTVPLEPTRSKTELAVVLAIFLMVGAVFSIAGVIGGAILDRSLRFPVDVKQGLDLVVLAVIPETPPGQLLGPIDATITNRIHNGRLLTPPDHAASRPAGSANNGSSLPTGRASTPHLEQPSTTESRAGHGERTAPRGQSAPSVASTQAASAKPATPAQTDANAEPARPAPSRLQQLLGQK